MRNNSRRSFAFALMCACDLFVAQAEEPLGEWYVGGSGALVLPQGGARMHRVGGGALRVGRYVSDNWAFEAGASWVEDQAGLSANALWHWQGWSLYGDLFGYSVFDPFFTIGGSGLVGHGPGQVGPEGGIGAFYHLTDAWSLRADARLLLGLDTHVEPVYTISVGVQYAF